jgi:hypothetical protein
VIVLPFITRKDGQWRVAKTLDTPFYRNVGFTPPVQYLRTYSTVSNYSAEDVIVGRGRSSTFDL